MFLQSDLDELVAHEEFPAISLYLPTHAAGREVRQDAIRLRNLLSTAAKRLAVQRRGPEIEALLQPARALVDAQEFWRHQAQGLAVFLAPGFDRVHRLPIEVREELSIGSHFCIKPLLSLVEAAGWFWVLTVTAGRTRLFQGSRWTFTEARGLDLPQGVADIRNESVYQEAHNASPVGRPQRGPSGLGKAQAFGDTPDDLHKEQLIELLHRVAAGVEPAIKRQPAPVILAATPEIQGNFREFARWKELLPEGIQENPDAMSAGELHRKSWRLLTPRFDKARADEIGQLNGLLGTGSAKAVSKPEEVIKAAHYGRIARLFLCDGAPLWGHFAEEQDRVVAHAEPAEGDDDLLAYAALMTLRHGGDVTLVDRPRMPPGGAAAAILRY